jgi:aminoglycoside 2''-phosphotransferase
LGDPALDLAAVSGYGSPFFNQVCVAYGIDQAMLERARFYRGTYALQEALHGIKHNDHAAFQSGIAKYV